MRRLLVISGAVLALLLIPAAAEAHPLGNFTINTYDGLRVTTRALEVDHVIDMAEIPTFQQRTQIDTDHNGTISSAEGTTYAASACAGVARDLTATEDGRAVGLAVKSSQISFPPGAGGLPTMRVTCSLEAILSSGPHQLSFTDPTFSDHIGWHEITAIGDRTTLADTTVPTSSISLRLTRYPQDLLRSPLDVRQATFSFKPGGPPAPVDAANAAGQQTRGVDALTRAFTNLVASHRTSIPFAILALLLAIVLGGMHALAPGHGKTVMAAYVVGRRGSFRQSAVIATTVTATHTIGVVLIGIVLTASRALAPERVYPWLGFASGMLLIVIGVTMVRARMRAGAHNNDHRHDHTHEPAPVGTRGLLAMGFVGGMVPSPSALIVLLGAIALGRLWFGILLIAAYGAGMGVTLAGAGLLLVRLRARMERNPSNGWARRSTALIPILAACVVLLLGIATAARGLAQI
jgi:nickel/cobalt exporter